VEISPHEVHLWGFLLSVSEDEGSSLVHRLAPDERERADRLVSVQHRREYIAAHGALRMVLSRYCDQRPEDLRFFRTDAGKPCLRNSKSLRFNLTHSHGRALIAVADGREVGVDLEAVRPQVDVMKLARRFLSSQDVRLIEDAEAFKRHERFLQIWVAREAVAKAEGTGIRFPLDQDFVALSKDAREGHLIGEGRTQPVPIRFLSLETGWIGAVAAEGTDWRVVWRYCN
jgi:4'-phosphopantetheinyl transferase